MGLLVTKRIYEPVTQTDGLRVLVDRLWPRGIAKERAQLHRWMKEIAPSADLRNAFHHDNMPWDEFEARYITELKHNTAVNDLAELVKNSDTVTLLYATNNNEHNHALVLKRFIEAHIDA